jgi:hypothetical protein
VTAWTITKDHIAEPGDPPATNTSARGMTGPHTAKLTAKQIIEHPAAKRFRMLDDDGEIYYEGCLIGDDLFAPLDDFGEPNAGCTCIQIFEDGQWKYL